MMRKNLFAARAVVVALALAFAAQAAAQQGAGANKEITIEGRLARTVEAGGWLIVAEYGKYLILNSRQYQSEPWFREGATVQATGEARQDAVTIYQEGMPFQARTMRARGRPASGGTQAGGNQGGNQGGTQTGGAIAVAGRGVTRVVVTGDATVQAQPDTVILSVAVVTQNASASSASSRCRKAAASCARCSATSAV